MSESLRIVLITQNEPFYLPGFFQTVLSRLGRQVSGLVILAPRLAKQSFWGTAHKHLCLYGPWDFLILSLRFAFCKLLARTKGLLRFKGNYSVENVARQFGIAVSRPANVNHEESLRWVAGHNPDLIVSISAPQVFRPPLLRLPRLGCINLHGGPLPRYQGLMPSFWALANGEKETAATVHRMTEKIDQGEILAQAPVPILPDDTLDALIKRSKATGAQVLLETIERFRAGDVRGAPFDKTQATYFHFPTRRDRLRFLKAGHRFR